jgi:hypothetical protein
MFYKTRILVYIVPLYKLHIKLQEEEEEEEELRVERRPRRE